MQDSILTILEDRYGFTKEGLEKLSLYVELLLKWNKSVNLIGKSTEEEIWKRHILDSAQLIEFIPNRDMEIADFGSGAGFPGIVLGVWGAQQVTLIESDNKKCIFLAEAKRVMSLTNVKILNSRIEHLKTFKSQIFTSRAFASISSILEISEPYMYNDSLQLLLKGDKVTSELSEANQVWDMDVTTHKSITDPRGHIVVIKNAKRKT